MAAGERVHWQDRLKNFLNTAAVEGRLAENQVQNGGKMVGSPKVFLAFGPKTM